jgi:phosphoglycolate phosphatase
MPETGFSAVIFDLDGTLLDSLDDLADSMNAVLAAMDAPGHPVEDYRFFVGEGIVKLAERVLPPDRRDEAAVRRCVELMSDEYRRRWDQKTRPYQGVRELLDGLARRRVPMSILSNKPAEFTRDAVARLLADWRFDFVLGVSDGLPRKPDPAGALRICRDWGIPPESCLFLGDTRTDMRTARSAGMYAVGALWGFRTAEELLAHGARALISRPIELLRFFPVSRPGRETGEKSGDK